MVEQRCRLDYLNYIFKKHTLQLRHLQQIHCKGELSFEYITNTFEYYAILPPM